MTKKAVIFDLDGTLLDTLDDLSEAVNYILKKYSMPPRNAREVRSFLGNGARELMRHSLPGTVSEEELDRYLDEYKKYYNAHSKIMTKPYPGVIQLLEELSENGIATAVVSNKPDEATRSLCEEYFGTRISYAIGDRAGVQRKPSAEPVRLAMDALGCDRAVYVGDSEVDVLTAKNAGLPSISLTWGFRDKDLLLESGADHFADNAEDLKALIYRLLSDCED